MIRKSLVIVFVLCLVSAPVVGPAVAGVSDTASVQEPDPPAGMVGIPSENIQDLRGDAAQDASNVSVGDLEGAVYTSRHAGSTDVSIVTPDQADSVAGGASPSDAAQEAVCSSPVAGQNPQFDCEAPESYGLVLTDDEYTEGREVAIRADVVEESLGYLPSKLTIQNNETGETWTSSASVVDGWLTADVEHFSSNAVTWSGEVDISMTRATNGSTTSYNVSDLDSVSNLSATVTGVVNAEWDNVTVTNMTNGGSFSVSAAGNMSLVGPSENNEPVLQFTGRSGGDLDAVFLSTNGNVSGANENGTVIDFDAPARAPGPVGDFDSDETLEAAYVANGYLHYTELSGSSTNLSVAVERLGVDTMDWDGDGAVEIPAKLSNGNLSVVEPDGTITDLDVSAGWVGGFTPSGNNLSYTSSSDDIRVISPSGSVVSSGVTSDRYVGDAADFDGDGSIEISYTNVYADLIVAELDGSTSDTGIQANDGVGEMRDFDGDGDLEVSAVDSYENLRFTDASGNSFSVSVSADPLNSANREYSSVRGIGGFGNSRNPQVDLDNDGTPEANVSGTVTPGETVTVELSSLTTGDHTPTVYTDAGTSVDVAVQFQERTQTSDAQLSVNGNATSKTATLSAGETVSLDVNSSWIQEGENTLSVELPSTTTDAPAMQMSLDYGHEAKTTQSVVYNDTTWEEAYNVSWTFAGERAEASLTIPFEGTVVDIKSLEYAINGSSWTTAQSSAYSLDSTTLTVDLREVYGSDIPANTTFEVRTDGRKVQVSGGTITVLEPTGIADSRLDTRLEVHDSPSDTPLKIQTGDTRFGSRIHYAYNQSWTDREEYTTITSSEQTLVLPNAETSDTTRISTIPVTVSPESDGDVRIVVDDPQTSEPVFTVKPGTTSGDSVTYTYLNAQDDTDYVLYSETDNVILDTGTANSPISLTGRDDAGVIQFLIDDGSGFSSDDDGGGGAVGPVSGPSPAETVLNIDLSNIWLVVLSAGGLGLLAFVYYRDGEDAIADAGRGTASGTRRAATWTAASIRDAAVWTASGLTSTASWLASHPYITAGLVGAGSIAAVVTGVITLPEGAGVFILVTGTPAVAYVVLVRRLGVSQLVWAAITGVAVILGFQLLGTDVFAVLADSQAFPILAAGGVYLAYQALQTYRADASTPEEKNVIEFNADDDDDEDDDEDNGGGGS